MPAYEVSRTLVKSQPEVWAELEQAERLAALLGDEAIKITRCEPESVIEWAGESARGTIEIAASGWGTKVSLKADFVAPVTEPAPEAEPEIEAVVEPEPEARTEPEPEAEPAPVKIGFWQKFKLKFAKPTTEPEPGPEATALPGSEPEAVQDRESVQEPMPEPESAPEPEPVAEATDYEAVLTAVLDHLGAAHKRPFVNNG